MCRILIVFIFCVLIGKLGYGQVDSAKVILLAAHNLKYYVQGGFAGCPEFKETENLYGFEMICMGCVGPSEEELKNNIKVVGIINKIYGEDWFEKKQNEFL